MYSFLPSLELSLSLFCSSLSLSGFCIFARLNTCTTICIFIPENLTCPTADLQVFIIKPICVSHYASKTKPTRSLLPLRTARHLTEFPRQNKQPTNTTTQQTTKAKRKPTTAISNQQGKKQHPYLQPRVCPLYSFGSSNFVNSLWYF